MNKAASPHKAVILLSIAHPPPYRGTPAVLAFPSSPEWSVQSGTMGYGRGSGTFSQVSVLPHFFQRLFVLVDCQCNNAAIARSGLYLLLRN